MTPLFRAAIIFYRSRFSCFQVLCFLTVAESLGTFIGALLAECAILRYTGSRFAQTVTLLLQIIAPVQRSLPPRLFSCGKQTYFGFHVNVILTEVHCRTLLKDISSTIMRVVDAVAIIR